MTEQIEVLNRDTVLCVLSVDYAAREVLVLPEVEPTGRNLYNFPFGRELRPTWEQYQHFLSTRCFPANRENADELLKSLGIARYDPEKIVRKTNGVKNEDFIWLRFKGQKIQFKDVRLR